MAEKGQPCWHSEKLAQSNSGTYNLSMSDNTPTPPSSGGKPRTNFSNLMNWFRGFWSRCPSLAWVIIWFIIFIPINTINLVRVLNHRKKSKTRGVEPDQRSVVVLAITLASVLALILGLLVLPRL